MVYLLRMFPSKIPINSIDTMKHAFAFISDMNKARLLLKASNEPDRSLAMEERRMTARESQDVEKRVLKWVKGVGGVQIPHTSGRFQ